MAFDSNSRLWDVPEITGLSNVLRANDFLQGLLNLIASGNMFVDGNFTVVTGVATPVEIKDAGGDGFTAGELNLITFPSGADEHFLTATQAGDYEISWSLSGRKTGGAQNELHVGIMINDIAIRENGEGQRTIMNNNDVGSLSGHTKMSLALNAEVSLWLESSTSVNIIVDHANLVLDQKSIL